MRDFDEPAAVADPALRRKAEGEAIPAALLGRAAAAGRSDAAGIRGVLGLQRSVGNAGTGAMLEEERSPVHDVVASGGEPLDRQTRVDMERSLGHDFSDVRVHRDQAAHDSATAVSAQAYTVGSHVVFAGGGYDPGSSAGRHMLAHELTHVVQQRSGPVDGTEAPGGIKVSHPSDRFEREASQVADGVMSAPAAPPAGRVQREAEEEELQTYVQREAEEEELQTYVQREAEEEELQTYVQRDEAEEQEGEG